MRKIKICGIFAALLSLFSCNDKIDVQQAYDFGITTWYLQKTIKPGQPVEIRFYLTREGYYADAEFSIGYVQIEGDGVVYDTGNSRLINREFCALQEISDLQDRVFMRSSRPPRARGLKHFSALQFLFLSGRAPRGRVD